MSEKSQFRAIKGVRDILPPDSSLWNWFEATARRVFESYGFREIRLPIFEDYALFVRSVGAESDIVSKELLISWDAPLDEWDYRRAAIAATLRNLLVKSEGAEQKLRETINPSLFAASLTNYLRSLSEANPNAPRYLESLTKTFALVRAKAKETDWEEFRNVLTATLDFQQFSEVRNYLAHFSHLDQWTKVCLRPEATASVIRAYIEHGMHMLPGNVKLYYAGPMFRRERPQKGRYRQFYQLGAEVIGQSDHPAIDAELMEMLIALLGECGIQKWTLLVNSIGCRDCRPAYVAKLKAALIEHINELKADSQRRVETNPLRVLDSKLPEEQPVIAQLPRITDHLCAACRAHFTLLQEQLKLRDIPYTVTPRLVRGLDYYMRTTFEITSPALGAQNALVGGGRYDGLSELLGGPPAKGMGFALGEDRFIDAIKDAGKVKAEQPVDVFIAWMGGPGAAAAYPAAVKLARRLRSAGFSVELPPEEMKLKKSLGLADKLGARYALIIGENEVASGRFTLKRLADGVQRELTESDLLEELGGGKGVGRKVKA